MLPSYRKRSINLDWKSTDWFPYDGKNGSENTNVMNYIIINNTVYLVKYNSFRIFFFFFNGKQIRS